MAILVSDQLTFKLNKLIRNTYGYYIVGTKKMIDQEDLSIINITRK